MKIQQLKTLELSAEAYQQQFEQITEKVCLCEGLCAAVYLKDKILKQKESKAVAICPGPNLAYFSSIYSLDELVNHIYGKTDLLNKVVRPHFFIKELNLYIDYLQKEISLHIQELNDKKQKQLGKFKAQLLSGITYYKELFNELNSQVLFKKEQIFKELLVFEKQLQSTPI